MDRGLFSDPRVGSDSYGERRQVNDTITSMSYSPYSPYATYSPPNESNFKYRDPPRPMETSAGPMAAEPRTFQATRGFETMALYDSIPDRDVRSQATQAYPSPDRSINSRTTNHDPSRPNSVRSRGENSLYINRRQDHVPSNDSSSVLENADFEYEEELELISRIQKKADAMLAINDYGKADSQLCRIIDLWTVLSKSKSTYTHKIVTTYMQIASCRESARDYDGALYALTMAESMDLEHKHRDEIKVASLRVRQYDESRSRYDKENEITDQGMDYRTYRSRESEDGGYHSATSSDGMSTTRGVDGRSHYAHSTIMDNERSRYPNQVYASNPGRPMRNYHNSARNINLEVPIANDVYMAEFKDIPLSYTLKSLDELLIVKLKTVAEYCKQEALFTIYNLINERAGELAKLGGTDQMVWAARYMSGTARREMRLRKNPDLEKFKRTFHVSNSFLHFAVASGNIDCVRNILLKEGTHVINTAKILPFSYTVLHTAAEYGTEKMINFLLDAGAMIEARTEAPPKDLKEDQYNNMNPQERPFSMEGCTPLILAARARRTNIVKALLDRGAEVEARDIYRLTSLHAAVRLGDVPLSRLLLNKAADVNAQGIWDYTPPRFAMSVDKAKANLNHLGITPLHDASYRGNKAVVDMLLASGAKTEVADKYGRTALHMAAEKNHVAVVESLLNERADPRIKDFNGNIPWDLTESKSLKSLLKRHGGAGKRFGII